MSGDSGFVHMSCLVNSQSRMINQSAAANEVLKYIIYILTLLLIDYTFDKDRTTRLYLLVLTLLLHDLLFYFPNH